MKHTLLFSAAIFAVSSAWAAAPAGVTVGGNGLAESETAPVECTKIADGKFQAFAELKAGEAITVKDNEGKEYTFENAKAELNAVYKIDINFNEANPTLSLKQIKHMMLKHCWTGTGFMLDYVGDGTWAGAFNWSTLSHQDDRYQIAMRYPRDDDHDHILGPVNSGNDVKPDGSAEYFNIKEAGNASQWDPKWKIADNYKDGKNHLVTVTMRGTYTHSFSEIGEIPASLSASGSALAEGTSINFNKVDDVTFEAFTKLQPGELNIGSTSASYAIGKGKAKAGSYSVSKEGVYCINVDCASGATSVKEVNAIRFYPLGKFGFFGEPLKYVGNGEWLGSVAFDQNEGFQFNENDYRIEMIIDNDIQHWGNAGDKNLKRVPWTFWGNAFNYGKSMKGEKFNLRVNLGQMPYVHSIEAYDPSAGIADVIVDENAPVEYFNLQGVRVANPENGLYIRRQGNKATKVFIK